MNLTAFMNTSLVYHDVLNLLKNKCLDFWSYLLDLLRCGFNDGVRIFKRRIHNIFFR